MSTEAGGGGGGADAGESRKASLTPPEPGSVARVLHQGESKTHCFQGCTWYSTVYKYCFTSLVIPALMSLIWIPRQSRLDTAKVRVCVSKNPKQTKNSQPTEWTAELRKAQGVAVTHGIVGATVPGRP